MTVQWVGPLLIELKKEKKKIFGRRKIVPILHPNICDWVITSSHVKMCTITFIEVTSHWVGTIDSIFAMICSLPCRRVAAVRCRGSCQHFQSCLMFLPQLLIIVCVFRCFPLVHQVWNCSSRLFISHYFQFSKISEFQWSGTNILVLVNSWYIFNPLNLNRFYHYNFSIWRFHSRFPRCQLLPHSPAASISVSLAAN